MAAKDDFVENLNAVKASVELVAAHIYKIKEKFPVLTHLEKQLSAIDYAQLNACLAFSIASIYFAQLRVRGVDHLNHPIVQELERVKLYMKKIIQIRKAEETGTCEEEARPRIDAEVAERVVRFYTAGNQALEDRTKRKKELTPPEIGRNDADRNESEQEENEEAEEEGEEEEAEEEEEGEISSVEEVATTQLSTASKRSVAAAAQATTATALSAFCRKASMQTSPAASRTGKASTTAAARASSSLISKHKGVVLDDIKASLISGQFQPATAVRASSSSSSSSSSPSSSSASSSSLKSCQNIEIDLVTSSSDKSDDGDGAVAAENRKKKAKARNVKLRGEKKAFNRISRKKQNEERKRNKVVDDGHNTRVVAVTSSSGDDLNAGEVEVNCGINENKSSSHKRKRHELKKELTKKADNNEEDDEDESQSNYVESKATHREMKRAKKLMRAAVVETKGNDADFDCQQPTTATAAAATSSCLMLVGGRSRVEEKSKKRLKKLLKQAQQSFKK